MSNRSKQATVDLHLHTPAGGDYRGDLATSPAEIVARCEQVGLDLVVIADHMTVESWTRFAPVTACASAGNGRPRFLPGVEIKVRSAAECVHFVAILNPTTVFADFAILMQALEPGLTSNGDLSAIEIAADPAFVAGLVRGCGGICIAAHVDRSNCRSGSEHDGDLLRSLAALDVLDAVECDDPDGMVPGFAEAEGIPCVASSDAHSLDEIGRRHTKILVDELSFAGLRRALSAGPASVVSMHESEPAPAVTQS